MNTFSMNKLISSIICLAILLALALNTGCQSTMGDGPKFLDSLRWGKRSPYESDVLTSANADRFKSPNMQATDEVGKSVSEMAQQVSYNEPISDLVWYDSYQDAKLIAERDRKPMLLMFTGSDWCSWCVRLKKDVFEQPEFKSWASDKFVLVELDFPRKKTLAMSQQVQNEDLKNRYNVRGFPTVVILDSDGSKLGQLGYEKTPNAWISKADTMMR